MIDNSAISEIEVEVWAKQKCLVALKSHEGKLFIDVRKWNKWNDSYIPGKGVMIGLDEWPLVIKGIESMIESQTVHT